MNCGKKVLKSHKLAAKMGGPSVAIVEGLEKVYYPSLRNLFGQISCEMKDRLNMFALKQDSKTWSDVSSIILRSNPMLTMWQAVIKVDPTFPRSGPLEQKGKVIRDWERIPDLKLFRTALMYATFLSPEENMDVPAIVVHPDGTASFGDPKMQQWAEDNKDWLNGKGE